MSHDDPNRASARDSAAMRDDTSAGADAAPPAPAAASASVPRDVIAVFPDRDSADSAFRIVTDHGYEPHEVDVLMTEDTRLQHFSPVSIPPVPDLPPAVSRAAQGAGVGASVGGAVGALAAALVAATSSFVLPGLSLVVAGPLASLLAGSAAGGLTGGLIGALIGWGIPAEAADGHGLGLRRGGILLRVRPHNAEDAEAIHSQWGQLHAQLIRA